MTVLTQHKGVWAATTIALCVILMINVFDREMVRLFTNFWLSRDVHWHGMTIQVDSGYVVFENENDVTILPAAATGEGKAGFARLFFVAPPAERRASFDTWKSWCVGPASRCRISTDSVPGPKVQCIEFPGGWNYLGPEDFHVRCRIGPGRIEAWYGGTQEAYSGFYRIIQASVSTLRSGRKSP